LTLVVCACAALAISAAPANTKLAANLMMLPLLNGLLPLPSLYQTPR
jgi:hypothetical protein